MATRTKKFAAEGHGANTAGSMMSTRSLPGEPAGYWMVPLDADSLSTRACISDAVTPDRFIGEFTNVDMRRRRGP